MLGTHDLGLFIASGLLLNVMPGPDSILIMARGASQGFRSGSAAALGIGAGTCVHVLAGALGLSALLAASASAFTVVKLLGAAYLVYLGITMLLKREKPTAETSAEASLPAVPVLRWGQVFRQGFLTNVLNPKVALFFLAFVPQFIDVHAPSKALAFLFLGAVFNINGMLWCHFLAWTSAAAGAKVRGQRWSQALARWLNRGLGVLFLSFGVRLALAEAR